MNTDKTRWLRCPLEPRRPVAILWAERLPPMSIEPPIELRQPADLKRVVREDLQKQLCDLDQMGMSRQQKTHRQNTLPRMGFYVLQGAQGRELLRLDEASEPKEEMVRMVDLKRRNSAEWGGRGDTPWCRASQGHYSGFYREKNRLCCDFVCLFVCQD